MRVEGRSDGLKQLVFPHGLVRQILNLLVDTWHAFQPPTDAELEPAITNRFVVDLKAERRRQELRFRIEAHAKDLEGLDPNTGRDYVEIDIYIPYGYDTRCYFGIEAKKLNTTSSDGKWASCAGGYAGDGGMGCFVDGRYASYQCEGAMIGYVMDGNCARAKSSISAAIDKRARLLGVPEPCPLTPAQDLPGFPEAFETRHTLNRGDFTIYHVLLGT